MKIGVLALQGAVAEHIKMIEKAGAQGVVVKKSGAAARNRRNHYSRRRKHNDRETDEDLSFCGCPT